jgi:predicted Zn-dependent protease with MMP-like domain
MFGGLSILILAQCGGSVPATNPYATNRFETIQNYFGPMTSLKVEVIYEAGAEPYTGAGLGRREVWRVSKDNLSSLFSGRSVATHISVPEKITEMQKLPAQNKFTWTEDELVQLAQTHRQNKTSQTGGSFVILFLNGFFSDSGVADSDVLGVNLTGTSIVAIFKPVITAAWKGEHFYVGKFIEQSTVVHEMGHALGLVNDSLPMVTPHQDVARGSHCTNENCVMFWEDSGAAAAKKFVKQYVKTGNEDLFAAECLQDARSYKP